VQAKPGAQLASLVQLAGTQAPYAFWQLQACPGPHSASVLHPYLHRSSPLDVSSQRP
jgi:hypothetical protein